MQEPQTLNNLRELRRNADLGKFRHFAAARRSKSIHNWLGVSAIVINIALGSVFLFAISEEIPTIAKWVSAFLALIGALLGGFQTFFRFSKSYEGHHRVANQYTAIVRDVERLGGLFSDELIDLKELASRAEPLHNRYHEAVRSAEDYLTSQKDYKEAKRKERARREGLEDRGLLGNEVPQVPPRAAEDPESPDRPVV